MTVMVVVTDAEEAAPLLRWGARFARARREALVVLQAGRGTQAQAAQDAPLEAPDDAHPVRSAVRAALPEALRLLQGIRPATGEPSAGPVEAPPASEASPAPPPPPAAPAPGGTPAGAVRLRTVSHRDLLAAVLSEERQLAPSLLLVGFHDRADPSHALGLRLLETAWCDTLLLRAGPASGGAAGRLLIPAAGGPHAEVALRLGVGVVEDSGGRVCPLYVEPNLGELSGDVGARLLNRNLRAAGLGGCDRLEPRVVVADNPFAGIAAVAREGFDLVLVGATDRGLGQRLLFGTVPDRLLAGPDGLAIGVLRRGRGFATRTLAALRERLGPYLPRLEREDRLALFARVQTGSVISVDFLALMALATSLASLGLLQDSPSVVIGAMLVAPLMMPMIGGGLALVQGNVVLVRDAARSIGIGFLCALTLGFCFGLTHRLLFPGAELSHELLARGSPNVLDLMVAWLSGLAAAYALARPGLMGAMAGVAIAAALVPPVSTVGISLAKGHFANGRGAALLFATNLIAIVLGAATAFKLVGVGAVRAADQPRLWVRRMLLGLILATAILVVPLGSVLFTAVAEPARPEFTVTPALRRALRERLAQAGLTLIGVERRRDEGHDLEVLAAVASTPPPAGLAAELARLAGERLGRAVTVRLVALHADRQEEGSWAERP